MDYCLFNIVFLQMLLHMCLYSFIHKFQVLEWLDGVDINILQSTL